MADQTPEANEQQEFIEVPEEQASTNFFWTLGHTEVFNLQTTLRGNLTDEQVRAHFAMVKWALSHVVNAGGHAKQVGGGGHNGQQPITTTVAAPAPPAANAPASAPAVLAGPQESGCAMIEIGTAYGNGKTQLKFHVNGFEKPLTYTRSVEDMVKLLAPLGFTAAHIIIGQKYPVNAVVTHAPYQKDGKTYHNVMAVRPA